VSRWPDAPEVTVVPNALVLNPRTDHDFVAYAESLFADGRVTAEGFEARLRERYPSAVVRPRELASEQYMLWYCYRDGAWTPPV
jgi:hypothetical protein